MSKSLQGQAEILDRDIFILLYGSSYWREVINFDALVRHGMIAAEDLNLLHFADDPATTLRLLKDGLSIGEEPTTPAFAKSVTCRCNPAKEECPQLPSVRP